jgi:glycosyltransferase involved in cell wall biosynthesis
MSKVSVLIPTYNTKEDWLKESIESVLNQTFQDFEIIILDDGSKNSPEALIKSFNDDRIKFYQNETNLGVGKTRNKLLDLATGEYIAFQDSDDISLPTRLEKQVKFLDENPDFSGVSAWLETFPNKKVLKNKPEPKILDFLGGCNFTQGCAMLRLNKFKEFNLKYNIDLTTSEDYDLWSRSIEKIKLYNLQEVLLKYRRNSQSLVHTQNKKIKDADLAIKQRLLDKLTNDKKLQEKIIRLISKNSQKQSSIFEKIFSIRNEWDGLNKNKILQIFGIKIKIKG